MAREEEIMEDLPGITLRGLRDGDIDFLLSSWLKSYRNRGVKGFQVGKQALPMKDSVYYLGHHDLAERAIKEGVVIVACPSDDTNVIYGYIIGEIVDGADVIHYIFVKQDFRGFGIGGKLFNALSNQEKVFYTGEFHFKKKIKGKILVFNPYLFFNGGLNAIKSYCRKVFGTADNRREQAVGKSDSTRVQGVEA